MKPELTANAAGHGAPSRQRRREAPKGRRVDPAALAEVQARLGAAPRQSAGTDNPKMLSFGAEGARWPENALYMARNTLINDFHAGSFVHVWSDKLAGDVEVWLLNNLLVGNGELSRPAQGRFDGNRAVGRGELIEQGGVPSRLTSGSPLRGAVRPPGEANEWPCCLPPNSRLRSAPVRCGLAAGWHRAPFSSGLPGQPGGHPPKTGPSPSRPGRRSASGDRP